MTQETPVIDTMGLRRDYRGCWIVCCQDCGLLPDKTNIRDSITRFFIVEYTEELYGREHLLCVCVACVPFYRQSPEARITRLDKIDTADILRLSDLVLDVQIRSCYQSLWGDILRNYRERTGDTRYSLHAWKRASDVRTLLRLEPLKSKAQLKTRRPIPASLRYSILQRDGFRCQTCGRSPTVDDVILHVDHIVPVVKGGTNERRNLRTLCADCNLGKSDK